jgi:hypothetical protein
VFAIAAAAGLTAGPLGALGVIIVGETGIAIAYVMRGVSEELYAATRYHTRRLLNVPEDWKPPEDR